MTSIIEKRLSLHQSLVQKEEENNSLRSQNLQLQALATLGSATCMIAHEINNLLTPLTTYAALAVQNPHDMELAKKVLDKTVRNCQRASKIMQSVLAMANGEKRQCEEVGVKALVEQVFTCLCRDLAKDGITVQTNIPDDLRLTCSPVQIEQVLMNLILNARDAMLPGGGILKLAASPDADRIVLTVSDTGKGIPAEHMASIFRPFFTTKRGSNSPAGSGSGSGVGLAFCKRIVDAHGGEIGVTSHVNQGSTFTIRLPQTGPHDRP